MATQQSWPQGDYKCQKKQQFANLNVDALERELEELRAQAGAPPKDTPQEPAQVAAEAEGDTPKVGWEKRYGDLRRHSQKEKERFEARIAELEAKASNPPSQIMPKSEQDLQEWVSSNGELASAIFALVDGQATKKYSDIDNKIKELESAQETTRIERERNEIRAEHNDFDDIVQDDDFHKWVASQITGVQDAIYDGTPKEVIWGLNLYKKEQGIKQKTSNRDAAKYVRTPSSDAPVDKTKGRFSESQIEAMSSAEYEANKAAIQAAIQNRTFIYDLSGGARQLS